MAAPKVLIIAGYGLNCEDETLLAFERAGATGDIIHINDILAERSLLGRYQILAVPGGFSYGDDTGSGNALAGRLCHNLWEELHRFVEDDRLVIGICNGCQTLVNLGLVPGIDGAYGERKLALLHNASARYQCRWVDTKVTSDHCVWTRELTRLHLPIAHGEGNFAMSDETLNALEEGGLIALRYVHADGSPANGEFPANPNGSRADIAGVTDPSGRVLALMPHPERGMFTHHREDWRRLATETEGELPETTEALTIFTNGVRYFA